MQPFTDLRPLFLEHRLASYLSTIDTRFGDFCYSGGICECSACHDAHPRSYIRCDI